MTGCVALICGGHHNRGALDARFQVRQNTVCDDSFNRHGLSCRHGGPGRPKPIAVALAVWVSFPIGIGVAVSVPESLAEPKTFHPADGPGAQQRRRWQR